MGTGDILLGGNPAMDQYPVQGGVAILLGMHRATETGISSGCVGLWLVCALPLEGGSNRDCGVEVTKTNEMASQGANICPSFISLSLSERPPKKSASWVCDEVCKGTGILVPRALCFSWSRGLVLGWEWVTSAGKLAEISSAFFCFIALEQKGFLRLVVAFAFRETSMFSLKVRRR